MTVYKEFNVGGGRGGNPLGGFAPLIALVLFFVALFFLAKGVFWLLSWVAPILLLATAVIDYNVIVDYIKFLFKLLKENPIVGIIGIVLSVVGFPIVSGFLFLKAIARRGINAKMEDIKKQKEEEFVPYEEVTDEEDFLELPEIQKAPSAKGGHKGNDTSEYEDLFD